MFKKNLCLFIVLIISLSVLMLLGVSANETQKGSVEFSRDSGYYLNEKGYICGVPENTSLDAFLSNLAEGQDVEADAVATGAVVTKYVNSVKSSEAQIVIKGDVSRDGRVTTADYFKLKKLIGTAVADIILAAGDIDGNGRISSYDYIAVKGYFNSRYDLYAKPEGDDMNIVKDGVSQYRIVYGENIDSETIDAFVKVIKEKTGCTLQAVSYDANYVAAEYEILVGINKDGFESGEYQVKAEGNKVILSGCDKYAISLAVSKFCKVAITGQNMELPAEYVYTNTYFYPIAVTDQKENKIKIYNVADGGITKSLAEYNTAAAGLRFREIKDTKVVLSTNTGYANMLYYDTGRTVWSCTPVQLPSDTGNYNGHAIELLPNGVIAVAGSSANAITFFDFAVKNHTNKVRVDLTDAHGVIWDPQNNVLWACGKKIIRGYEVTLANKVITVTQKYDDVILPTDNAHDFKPVYGQPGKYWITTGSKVYIFDSNTRTVSDVPSDIGLTLKKVKGIGSFADGSVFQSIATGSNESWQTDTVKGFLYNELLDIYYPMDYVNSNLYIYKVSTVNFNYQ